MSRYSYKSAELEADWVHVIVYLILSDSEIQCMRTMKTFHHRNLD